MSSLAGIRRVRGAGSAGQAGFSMIEVLIALVVLAIGLLGLALLQTVNLRYTKSAQQRTQAVNLAGELLDTIRTNRSELAQYEMTAATFGTVVVGSTGCQPQLALTAANNATRWKCEIREALGPTSWAIVDVSAAPEVAVTVGWDEPGIAVLVGEPATVTLRTTL